MPLYQLQITVIDWKNRLLLPAAKDIGLGKKKCLQREADAHLHPVLCTRVLGALPPFLPNAFIA